MAEIGRIRVAQPAVEIAVYPGAGHAFLNPEQNGYHPAAAAAAWTRAIAFLDAAFAV
jgi:dienelactone hydrolase